MKLSKINNFNKEKGFLKELLSILYVKKSLFFKQQEKSMQIIYLHQFPVCAFCYQVPIFHEFIS